jgi:hypothetical protein
MTTSRRASYRPCTQINDKLQIIEFSHPGSCFLAPPSSFVALLHSRPFVPFLLDNSYIIYIEDYIECGYSDRHVGCRAVHASVRFVRAACRAALARRSAGHLRPRGLPISRRDHRRSVSRCLDPLRRGANCMWLQGYISFLFSKDYPRCLS